MASTAPEQLITRYTWDDFAALDEDDRRELIDGQLTEAEVPTAHHERIVALLAYYLLSWVLPRRAGEVHGSGYKLRVDADRGLMPDLQFYAADNPAPNPLPPQGMDAGRPDLAVEVISPTSRRRDRVTKLNAYAALGVSEYWIIDPEAHTLECFTLDVGKGGYHLAAALAGDATFRPARFDGLEIPLAELWTTER